MTLHSSGPISLAQVRTELGLSGPISLGQANVRALLQKTSGPISLHDAYGKANRITHAYTFDEHRVGQKYLTGYNPTYGMGSLSPLTMLGTSATISRFEYENDQGDMYFAMELTFNVATPFKFIDVYDQNGTKFTTLTSPGGTGVTFTFEEGTLNKNGHESWMRVKRNLSFVGRA